MAMTVEPIDTTPFLTEQAGVGGFSSPRSGPEHFTIGGRKKGTVSAPDLDMACEPDEIRRLDQVKEELTSPRDGSQPAKVLLTAEAVAAATKAAIEPEVDKSAMRRRQQTSFASSSFVAHSSVLARSTKDFCVGLTSLSRKDVWDRANTILDSYQTLKVIAEAMGVSPAFVMSATAAAVLGFFLFGIGGSFVCTMVGALYPAFESYKALESSDLESLRFWMTYWIVYASINSIECISYYIIVNLPFYYPLKLASLMWLASHSTGGSTYMYQWAIAPTFAAYRERIDDALDQSRATVKHGLRRAATTALGAGVSTGTAGIRTMRRAISLSGSSMTAVAQLAVETARSTSRRASRASSDVSTVDQAALEKVAAEVQELSSDDESKDKKATDLSSSPSAAELPIEEAPAQKVEASSAPAPAEDTSPAATAPRFRGPEVAKAAMPGSPIMSAPVAVEEAE